MMNENVKKVYAELIDIQNTLKHSDAMGNLPILECLDRLSTCVTPLLEEEQYAYFAASLQNHVKAYDAKKVELDFIKEYLSKLIELIEVTNKPAKSEEAKAMYQEAKAVCGDIASTVQMGFNTTKEVIKAEGPRYAAEAVNSLRGMGKKIGEGFKKWLEEDDEGTGDGGKEESEEE